MGEAGSTVRGDGNLLVGILAGMLCFATLLLAYDGLVKGRVRVTQGPKRGPPTRVWEFHGNDAIRIGAGSLSLCAGGAVLLVLSIRKRRPPFGVRPSSALFLALASLGILAIIPPTGLDGPGFTAGFYGFLAPALAGVISRKPSRLAWSVVAGIALAVLLGGDNRMDAVFSGGLAAAMLGLALLSAFDLRFERVES